MTRYAVGDVQGCLQPLTCLLQQVHFEPGKDELWLVGDLINRGPESLATLRFVHDLGSSVRMVLGNHDLHFLAIYHGVKKIKPSDTLTELLNASDCAQLAHWLQQQPLLYSDPRGDFSMVHAGIPPMWSLEQASALAREVETALQSSNAIEFFQHMYGNEPAQWSDALSGYERLRVITNYFTRMRFCSAAGALDLVSKLTHSAQPGFQPWFSFPHRLTRDNKLIFGHWAALQGQANTANIFALDTGCVWGNALTLLNLETGQQWQCNC